MVATAMAAEILSPDARMAVGLGFRGIRNLLLLLIRMNDVGQFQAIELMCASLLACAMGRRTGK